MHGPASVQRALRGWRIDRLVRESGPPPPVASMAAVRRLHVRGLHAGGMGEGWLRHARPICSREARQHGASLALLTQDAAAVHGDDTCGIATVLCGSWRHRDEACEGSKHHAVRRRCGTIRTGVPQALCCPPKGLSERPQAEGRPASVATALAGAYS